MIYKVDDKVVDRQTMINKMLSVMTPERANYWLAEMEWAYCTVEKCGIKFTVRDS